jgi:hypothetical protein
VVPFPLVGTSGYPEPFPENFLERTKEIEGARNVRDQPHSIATWDDSTVMPFSAERQDGGRPGSAGETVEERDQRIASEITSGTISLLKTTGDQIASHLLFRDIWADLEASAHQAYGEDVWEIARKCNARWWAWAQGRGDRPVFAGQWFHPPATE